MNDTTDRSHDWAILAAMAEAYALMVISGRDIPIHQQLQQAQMLAEWESTMIDLA